MKVNGADISIEIGASADEATAKVRELTRALIGLKGVMNTGWNNPVGGSGGGSGGSRGGGMAKEFGEAKKKADFLATTLKSIGRIMFYRAIRTAIKAIGKAFSEGAENAYWYSKTVGGAVSYVAEALDSVSSASFKMSNQMGASVATLKAAVAPILIELANLVTRVADFFTQLFAVIGGKTTYMKAVDYTKTAYENTAKGAKAAKEWKNQLLGFDEINKLEAPADTSGGGGSALEDYANMFQPAEVSDFAKTVKEHLMEIEAFAHGAELGIGLALLLSGANIPLGLALTIHGAYKLWQDSKEDWGAVKDKCANAIPTLATLGGIGALFGIGAVLTLSGIAPAIGIPMMIAGLAMGTAYAALNWTEIPEKVKRTIAQLEVALGLAMLGIGAMIAVTSPAHLALGIGLMVAGAATLASAAVISWTYLPDKVKEEMQTIGKFASISLMALGAILLFVPGMTGIAIGLLIAGGAVGLATIASFDPEGFLNKLAHPFDSIKSSIASVEESVKSAWEWTKGFFSWLVGADVSVSSGPANKSSTTHAYASGGFPEDGLFFANHNELVGQFSNGRTAVANNEQITNGIASAVYDAFTDAMGNSYSGNQPVEVRVYLDSREIKAGQDRLARATGSA